MTTTEPYVTDFGGWLDGYIANHGTEPVRVIAAWVSVSTTVLAETEAWQADIRRAVTRARCQHRWSLDAGRCIDCGEQL